MKIDQFQSRYPALSNVLSDGFWDIVESDHVLKLAVERDRIKALDYMSNLVQRTPWREIRTSYNDLHRRNKFEDFLTEMWAYIAISRWLCDDPTVADLPGTSGLPDFECDSIDIDATRLHEAEEEYRVRRELEDKFGDRPYIGILTQKTGFDKQASTGDRWANNEKRVDKLLREVETIEPDNPEAIETESLKVEFRKKSSGPFGFISRWQRAEKIVPDEEGKIPRVLKGTIGQARDSRPLVVFIDCQLKSIDEIEEVVWILIGTPYGFAFKKDISISEDIKRALSNWEDYLENVGAVPSDSGTSAIRPGDEGVFADDELNVIAGVMIRLKTGEVGYVPNVYTDEIDARGVYDRLGWGMNTVSLKPPDL